MHIAAELQLLRGDHDRAFDISQHQLAPAARHLVIELTKLSLLPERLGELGFEKRGFCLLVAHGIANQAGLLLELLLANLDFLQPADHVAFDPPDPLLAEPCRRQQSEQCGDTGNCEKAGQPAGAGNPLPGRTIAVGAATNSILAAPAIQAAGCLRR